MKKILFFGMSVLSCLDFVSGIETPEPLNRTASANSPAVPPVVEKDNTKPNVVMVPVNVLARFPNGWHLCSFKNLVALSGNLGEDLSTYVLIKKVLIQYPSIGKMAEKCLIQGLPLDVGRVVSAICSLGGEAYASNIAYNIVRKIVKNTSAESRYIRAIIMDKLPTLLDGTSLEIVTLHRNGKYRIKVDGRVWEPHTAENPALSVTVALPVTKVKDINVGSKHLGLYQYESMNAMREKSQVRSYKNTYLLVGAAGVQQIANEFGVILRQDNLQFEGEFKYKKVYLPKIQTCCSILQLETILEKYGIEITSLYNKYELTAIEYPCEWLEIIKGVWLSPHKDNTGVVTYSLTNGEWEKFLDRKFAFFLQFLKKQTAPVTLKTVTHEFFPHKREKIARGILLDWEKMAQAFGIDVGDADCEYKIQEMNEESEKSPQGQEVAQVFGIGIGDTGYEYKIQEMSEGSEKSPQGQEVIQANALLLEMKVLAMLGDKLRLCVYENREPQKGELGNAESVDSKLTHVVVKKDLVQDASTGDEKWSILQGLPLDAGRVISAICKLGGQGTGRAIASVILGENVNNENVQKVINLIRNGSVRHSLAGTDLEVSFLGVNMEYGINIPGISWVSDCEPNVTIRVPVTKVIDMNTDTKTLGLYKYENMNNIRMKKTRRLYGGKETYLLIENGQVETLEPREGLVLWGSVRALLKYGKITYANIKNCISEEKGIPELRGHSTYSIFQKIEAILKKYGIDIRKCSVDDMEKRTEPPAKRQCVCCEVPLQGGDVIADPAREELNPMGMQSVYEKDFGDAQFSSEEEEDLWYVSNFDGYNGNNLDWNHEQVQQNNGEYQCSSWQYDDASFS